MKTELPLSVSIITLNEESNLERTLEAISDIAEEIVIIDSDSEDRTCEIAHNFGAKVYNKKWMGFADQKNAAIAECRNEWILTIDADEVVNSELKEAIRNAVNNPTADAYYINRKTNYIGKTLNYAWQPDWNLRLAKRSANPVWHGGAIHESLQINGSTAKLPGHIIHYSYSGIKHHFQKTIKYAKISAQVYFDNKRQFRLSNLLVNPLYAFIRLYFIRKGCLDGTRGFIAGISSAFGTFLKYAFLWELEKKNR